MNERAQRVILFLLVSLMFAMHWKSHGTSRPETSMAFVHYSTGRILARLEGEVDTAGIYQFSDGDILMTAINMTVSDFLPTSAELQFFQQKIPPNSVISIIKSQAPECAIQIKPLKFKDMLLLGVPLDPDRLSAAEWEALPGIGPALAFRIIKNRQEYGDFGSVRALGRVPGVSERKIYQLISFF